MSQTRRPGKCGLYDPQWEHDACGIGAVANISGRRDHSIIEYGNEVLLNLMHRGAAGSDESTGDGAGILFQIPHEFFDEEVRRLRFRLPERNRYGVAMVFGPRDPGFRGRCEDLLNRAIDHLGLKVLGWRDVPTDNSCLGELAREAEPSVRQVFIDGVGLEGIALERQLYLARKRAERLVTEHFGEQAEDFYLNSMSCRTLLYKGMFLAPQLFAYYPDLSDSRIVSALALVHQRYSTNTFPNWRLAQPFRMLAHNGEINTLSGNTNRMRGREAHLSSPLLGEDLSDLYPIITPGASDSACFDNVLELLWMAGRSLPHAMMMLIPEAFGPSYHISTDKRAFYEYHASIMEPWDGPAAMVFTDGRLVGGTLDRNGLRPARYVVTSDGLMVLASEAGVIDFPVERIQSKGRLQPGKMFLVDTEQGRIVVDNEVKGKIARQQPYRRWLERNQIELRGLFGVSRAVESDPETTAQQLRAFGYTREELQMILVPMAANGQEPVGSMGTDTPLAVLSDKPKPLFNYFKQLFAQVTNPPIDPLREGLVMSLVTFIGKRRNLLDETPEHCRQLTLPHPILTNDDIERLRAVKRDDFQVETVGALFDMDAEDPGGALRRGIDAMIDAAEAAIRRGAALVILSDRGVTAQRAPIPSLLATAAVHHGLLDRGLRTEAGLVVESGEPREVMHFCLLCGYGANAVNPYLAFEAIHTLYGRGEFPEVADPDQLCDQYVTAVKKGILKTMSKMGISTLRSYRGAQLFEAVGLDRSVIDAYFERTTSRIGGADLDVIAREALSRHGKAFGQPPAGAIELDFGGEYHLRLDGERHMWNQRTVAGLQHAVRANDPAAYAEYAQLVDDQSRSLCTLRGLLEFAPAEPVPLEEVESRQRDRQALLHRCHVARLDQQGGARVGGDRHEPAWRHEQHRRRRRGPGALSAVVQRGLEEFRDQAGGERPVRGDHRVSGPRQDAADQDGAGGQARRRRTAARPQGDRGDRQAPVLDAGGHADLAAAASRHLLDRGSGPAHLRPQVQQPRREGFGQAGGRGRRGHGRCGRRQGERRRGADQRSRRWHRGQPALVDQARGDSLGDRPGRDPADPGPERPARPDRGSGGWPAEDGAGRRGRGAAGGGAIRLRDGGPGDTGMHHDAEVSSGHLSGRGGDAERRSCARSSPATRRIWSATCCSWPKRCARSWRSWASAGSTTWWGAWISCTAARPSTTGRRAGSTSRRRSGSRMRRKAGRSAACGRRRKRSSRIWTGRSWRRRKAAIENGEPVKYQAPIKNVHRAVGAILSNRIVKRHGMQGLPDGTIEVTLTGSAGQSFGAFLAAGVTLRLIGDSNDYVGKGLSGGRIVVQTPPTARFAAHENIIVGNTLLYGATSGEAFINGVAGERFAVRNSGAVAVVEGLGDHGCEYMTGGTVVVIGRTGRNFGAGMSGGVAYVLDEHQLFDTLCNLDMVDLESLWQDEDEALLHFLITRHRKWTGSEQAQRILDSWDEMAGKFVKVMPIDYREALERQREREEARDPFTPATEEVYG